ncbi:MAG TPA: branched-chain-amino-acid transaminase [Kineosporiaceae bacterium]
MSRVWFDGAVQPAAQVRVSLWNHSLHYGFGVFEGLRSYSRSGRPAVFRLEDHVARLYRSAELVGLEVAFEPGTVVEACHEVLAANGLTTAYLRPLAFLGDGLEGIRGSGVRPHLAVLAWSWDVRPADGLSLAVPGMRKPDPASVPLQAKATGQYLQAKVAQWRAHRRGFHDAIVLDHQGMVSEATAQNVFAVVEGRLVTPPTESCLIGITRDAVLGLAAGLGIDAAVQPLTVAQLLAADEVFLTSTAVEVLPVHRIENRELRTGPVTRLLMDAYRDTVSGVAEVAGSDD